MKLSTTIAGATLAASLLMSVAANATQYATVTETYDNYNFDAAFMHVTNTTSFAFTNIQISGGDNGGFTDYGPLAVGASADFLMGDNENYFIGSQGTALVTVVAHGHTFSGSFTDVLGDPDVDTGPTKVGMLGVGAVPEPASWALMLAGFGFLGVSMRSSRRNTVAA